MGQKPSSSTGKGEGGRADRSLSPARRRAAERRRHAKEVSGDVSSASASGDDKAGEEKRSARSRSPVRSPPPPPPRQILSAKDEARAARRAEHQRLMEQASRDEYEKAGYVKDEVAAAERRAKEEWEAREAQRRADAAERAEQMAEENRKLKEELQEMKLAQAEAARVAAEEAKKPAQVDEASLAEKIREMLSADMKKQNERMLEQHTEELQLSLLSKLKFVATQAQEQEAADLAEMEKEKERERERKREKESTRRSKGSGKGKKKKGKKGGKKRRANKVGARGSGQGGVNTDEYYERLSSPSSSPSSRGSSSQVLQRGRSRQRRRRAREDVRPGSQSPSSGSPSPGESDYFRNDGRGRGSDVVSTKMGTTASTNSSAASGKFSGVSRPHLLSPLEGPAGFGQQAQAKRVKQKREARSKLARQREMERQSLSEDVLDGGRREVNQGGEDEEEEEEVEEEQQQQPTSDIPLPPAAILGPEDTLESLDESTARLLRKSWELIGGAGGGPEMDSRNVAPGSAYLDKLDEMAGGAARRLEESGGGGALGVESTASTSMESVKKKRTRKKKKKKKKAAAASRIDEMATTANCGEKSVENPEEEKDDEQPPLLTPTSVMSASGDTLPLSPPRTSQSAARGMMPAGSAAGSKGFKDPTVMLGKREWENEVARNILVLYKANMSSIRQAEADRKAAANLKATMEKMDTDEDDDAAATAVEGSSDSYSDGQEPGSKSPTRRRRGSNGGGSKLPPVKGAQRGSKKGGKDNDLQPSRMIKIQNSSHGGKAVKQHSPHQIWYAGSGNVRAVWDGLVVADEEEAEKAMRKLTSDFKLTGELEALEKQGKYFKYVALVEAILTARARIYERTESHWRLWRQLAVTANVFGLKLIDEKRFSQAMQMLKNATRLMDMETSGPSVGEEGQSGGQTTLSPQHRNELRAFIQDSYAYYYYRRGKSAAALQYAQKAMRIHVRLRAWEHVAKCHLHIGAILSRLRRHDEAIRAMGQVLLMVEDGRLESGGASAQKICLVAVTYHNIAAEQLLLSRVHEACVSSQNARRLARLSLSYSNRWLKNFEATHKMALAALSTQREVRTKIHSKEQAQLFQDLTGTLYT